MHRHSHAPLRHLHAAVGSVAGRRAGAVPGRQFHVGANRQGRGLHAGVDILVRGSTEVHT